MAPAGTNPTEKMIDGSDGTSKAPLTPIKFWRRLTLLLCLLVAVQAGHYAWYASGLHQDGSTGIGLGTPKCGTDHFCFVDGVKEGSTAQQAGIVAGDQIRLDRSWELLRHHVTGEMVGMQLRHGAIERHIVIRAAPYYFYAPNYIISAAFYALLALTGALIAFRAGHSRLNLLLALSLASYAVPGPYPRNWQNNPALFPFFIVLLPFLQGVGPIALAAAMRDFRRDIFGYEPGWIKHLFWPVMLSLPLNLLWSVSALYPGPVLGFIPGFTMSSLGFAGAALIAPLVLIAPWSSVPAKQHTRYAFMVLAVAALSGYAWIDRLIYLTTNNYADESWPVVIQLALLGTAAILFGYAILRHRVIDLGFAINRTLVYSLLSAVLLVLFGLGERAAEQLVPESAHRAGEIAQALIALGLFLTFHRLRDAIEHWVERIFFASWRLHEKHLETFIRQASFITRPEILVERTVDEFSRYAAGAEIAIYQTEPSGYARAGGGVHGIAERIDIDDPAIISLRADREMLHGGLGHSALLLPMVHRADLSGFVAIGKKRDNAPFRPDEEAKLMTATRQVGLDLYALRIEKLEEDNVSLLAQLAVVKTSAQGG